MYTIILPPHYDNGNICYITRSQRSFSILIDVFSSLRIGRVYNVLCGGILGIIFNPNTKVFPYKCIKYKCTSHLSLNLPIS